MKRAVFSQRARRDLRSIWHYIASDSVDAAERVTEAIRAAVLLLAEWPGMGHTRPDLTRASYRVWCVYSYLIIYRVHGGTLHVVRIVHGAQDLPALLRRR